MCCKSKYRGNYTRTRQGTCSRRRSACYSSPPTRQISTVPTITPPVQEQGEIAVPQLQVLEKHSVDDMFSFSEPPSYKESQLKTMNMDHIDLPESVRKYSSASTLEGMTIPLNMLGKYSGPVNVPLHSSSPSVLHEQNSVCVF